ncbi:MAG: L-serine ammonia-lyase, iron-sulfur-dependent subunit beta [Lachnospiraceae bacterium]
MSLFDIVGPIMVGPSSSHTAGAARIGYLARRLLAEPVAEATILLYGSFLLTGKGHGTDRALIAGLLGMKPDDERIPHSFEIAAEEHLQFTFGPSKLLDAHPNTAELQLTGINGRTLNVVACSLGGGRVQICQIDGIATNFCGDYPTLIIYNEDQPGHVTEVTSMLAHKSVNIATLQLFRDTRGGRAVMVIECDQEVPQKSIQWLRRLDGILNVSYLSLEE